MPCPPLLNSVNYACMYYICLYLYACVPWLVETWIIFKGVLLFTEANLLSRIHTKLWRIFLREDTGRSCSCLPPHYWLRTKCIYLCLFCRRTSSLHCASRYTNYTQPFYNAYIRIFYKIRTIYYRYICQKGITPI